MQFVPAVSTLINSQGATQQWTVDEKLFKYVVEEEAQSIRELIDMGTDLNTTDDQVLN
jgi:hypothetical protein